MIQKPLPSPASFGPRCLGTLKGLLSTVVLFPLLIVVNLVQLLSLATLPVSRRLFRAINRGCAWFWWGYASWWTESVFRIKPVFSGDDVPPRENAILVVNHQQMPDIVALWSLAKRKGRIGDLKFVVKDVLKYVPGVGWGMLFLDCLFLKRDWEKDQTLIQKTFSKFSEEHIPVWLISFSEGTRITPKKIERSRHYAREAGLPSTDNVLIPRTKGFVASVQGLHHHIEAVYDVTIAYPTGIPTLWQLLCGYTREFHMHVKRYAIGTLPAEPAALADWLLERFREKDRLLHGFHTAFAEALTRPAARGAALPFSPWGSSAGVSPG